MANDENIGVIRSFLKADKFIISHHARSRMFQRNVSTERIKEVIIEGEIVEYYPDDYPCPSMLVLGFVDDVPLHVVIGLCDDHVRIITTYIPDERKWINFKKRR